jgi:hypothetical protein
MRLREHEVTLQGERALLRPMTEDDWDIVGKWEIPELYTGRIPATSNPVR